MLSSTPAPRIAVVIPCFTEANAIAQVIDDCRAALPQAAIHVFDNASTDDTAAVATANGAYVSHVALTYGATHAQAMVGMGGAFC